MKKTAMTATAVLAAAVIAGTAACGTHASQSTAQDLANRAAGSTGAGTAAVGPDMPAGGTMQGAMAVGAMDSSGTWTQPTSYRFRTVDDTADTTFNQLLGINDSGVIAGYFGSGAAGHPNQGYTVHHRAATFVDENVPHSVQTQVTGINGRGVTVGFWSSMNTASMQNDNTGFYHADGEFHSVAFPTRHNATPPVNQLLGVNDHGVAVGFYTDAAGNNHGYTFDTGHGTFHTVSVTGSTSTTAAAIDNGGDIAGFETTAGGVTEGFLLTGGRLTHLMYPGSSMTQALGVNNHREVVGDYQTGTGATAQTHGFTWTAKGGFRTADDPNGAGGTTVNGLNDQGDLVGFYVDAAGNTHGMLAIPGSTTTTTEHLTLAPMPNGTVTVTRNEDGTVTAHVSATGLTPGSTHLVEIDSDGSTGPVLRLGSLQADPTGRIDADVTSTGTIAALPDGSRFVIRLGVSGNGSNGSNGDAVAAEPIAESAALPDQPNGTVSTLRAVNVSSDGTDLGPLSGNATVVYDPTAQTLTVTLDATGLGAGNHAAHIHTGSCQSQGPVQYMLADFTADADGNVVNQTRTVTGVTQPLTSGAWYLNLHEGDMNSILVNGTPALAFRPLLCANG
jgi:hypothetical protein